MRQLTKRQQPKSSTDFLIVRRRPGYISQGYLQMGGRTFRCALGKTGLTSIKREGDGATPRGRFRLISCQTRKEGWKTALPKLPHNRIKVSDGWCDAQGDRNYNRQVRLPYPASHEKLTREDDLYDLFVVMDHNVSKRLRRGGSAIFFHLAREGYLPTEGCIAVSRRAMEWIAPRLSRRSQIIVE